MSFSNKKILVVEDDQDIREILTLILETEGYDVTGLDNGHDVSQIVHENPPDVLLLDVQLGDMDGRDICKELKHDPQTSDVPIIIVSATHGWHTRHEKQCQADDYLAKPFDISDLIGHVKRFAA